VSVVEERRDGRGADSRRIRRSRNGRGQDDGGG